MKKKHKYDDCGNIITKKNVFLKKLLKRKNKIIESINTTVKPYKIDNVLNEWVDLNITSKERALYIASLLLEALERIDTADIHAHRGAQHHQNHNLTTFLPCLYMTLRREELLLSPLRVAQCHYKDQEGLKPRLVILLDAIIVVVQGAIVDQLLQRLLCVHRQQSA